MLCKLIDFTVGVCTEYYSDRDYTKMVSTFTPRSWKPLPGVDYDAAVVINRTTVPLKVLLNSVSVFPGVDVDLGVGRYRTFPSGAISAISTVDYCQQWVAKGAFLGIVKDGRIEERTDEDDKNSRVDL